MEWKRLVLLSLVALVAAVTADEIPGWDQMGRAYNLNYYASSQGVDISKPAIFKGEPDQKGSCVGYTLPSDVSCNELATGVAEGYKVYSSQSQSQTANQQIGVGVEIASFSSTTSHSYSSEYYYTTNFASTSAFGQYYYYELDFSWEKRGISSEFDNDLDNKDIDMCTIAAKYGYYFLVSGYYGGDYLYSQSQSYSATNSSSSMETSISTSFSGFTSSVDFGQTTTGSSTSSFSEYRFTYNGCDYQCLRSGSTCTWIDSCRDKPALFAFSENTASLVDITTVLQAYGRDGRANASIPCVQGYLESLGIQEFGHVQLTDEEYQHNLTSAYSPVPFSQNNPTPVNCTITDGTEDNLVLSNVLFQYRYLPDDMDYGAVVEAMTCTWTQLDVENPGAATSYEKTMSVGQTNYGGAVGTVSMNLPPNQAIVGMTSLGAAGDCYRNYGLRVYYAELNLKSFSPPHVGTLDFGRYVDVLWTPGFSSTTCMSYTAPENTALSSIWVYSFASWNNKEGSSGNDFGLVFKSMARQSTMNNTIA
mmetsp:Transcript_16499/g.46531  ORF Transcript_16499/g.46531 Transcript_16499/m.46531 type:complete len:533 (+) Transcript_16499:101-1699(+)|eukprot:CAMPEP_0119131702 /NCGR_PEP_ID=MMETSP1310-20130426/10527_1 /TAXON_ID=464262 /ORGANISM="Genus nov. species nov., Strain RCC2339" /LENGTH=532 /DNA_ID=CAMNT_0007122293 /DNA_START=48 /DNA_END=1646 /DNA_ORIENTATION=-